VAARRSTLYIINYIVYLLTYKCFIESVFWRAARLGWKIKKTTSDDAIIYDYYYYYYYYYRFMIILYYIYIYMCYWISRNNITRSLFDYDYLPRHGIQLIIQYTTERRYRSWVVWIAFKWLSDRLNNKCKPIIIYFFNARNTYNRVRKNIRFFSGKISDIF